MGLSEKTEYSDNNIVEFRTNQLRPIKQMFDSIKNNMPDTSIIFTRTRMMILQLDGASHFMVNVKLEGKEFEHFYCLPPRDSGAAPIGGFGDGADSGDNKMVEINLSTIHINKAFKSVTNDDNVFCFTYEAGSDFVRLEFSSDKKKETRSYEIPIQNNVEDIRMGEITGTKEFPYSLTMPCGDLQRICRDLKTHECDKVIITHDGNSLAFTNKSNTRLTIRRYGTTVETEGSVKFIKLPEEDTIYSETFKFATLNDFSKCQTGGEGKIVTIMLQQGSPLILHFQIGTLGTMEVAVATIIQEETI